MKMNRSFFTTLLVASAITANAQTNVETDSLTMETMMHNLPEVMVKGARPIVKVERGMLSYNMPLLLKQLPADNAYEALTRIPGISDATGKISFLGNEVTLIVNGQATTLTQEQLAERLKAMPAAQLAKADNDSNFNAKVVYVLNFCRNTVDSFRIDSIAAFTSQSLT